MLNFEKNKLKLALIAKIFLLFSIFFLALSFSEISVKTDELEDKVIVFLVDTSGSMNADDLRPNRLEAAKLVIKDFVKDVDANFALISFSNYPILRVFPTKDKKYLMKSLDNLSAEGGTNIGAALELAYSILDNFKNYDKTIILLSDGKPTQGPDPLKIVEKQNDNKVKIFTISIGKEDTIIGYSPFGTPLRAEVDKELLRKLAEISDGRFFDSLDNKDLVNAYNEIKKGISIDYYYKDISKDLSFISLLLISLYLLLTIYLSIF